MFPFRLRLFHSLNTRNELLNGTRDRIRIKAVVAKGERSVVTCSHQDLASRPCSSLWKIQKLSKYPGNWRQHLVPNDIFLWIPPFEVLAIIWNFSDIERAVS